MGRSERQMIRKLVLAIPPASDLWMEKIFFHNLDTFEKLRRSDEHLKVNNEVINKSKYKNREEVVREEKMNTRKLGEVERTVSEITEFVENSRRL